MPQKFKPTVFQNLKFLFYGESGVGKTRLASTFPSPVFLDTEGGLASVVQEVDFIRITTAKEAWQALAEVRNLPNETIVVDSITKLQQILVESTVMDFPNKRPYDLVPTLQDYGKVLFEFQLYLNQLMAIPKTLVLIGVNTAKAYDEDIIQPALTGRMTAKSVCAAMDIIGYCTKVQKEDNVIYLTIFNLATHVTKDRTGRLPQAIPDCSWSKIQTYLNSNH